MIGDFVQTHVLESLSCKLLDLPEQGSFAPSGRSNRHLHGGQSSIRRQRCAGLDGLLGPAFAHDPAVEDTAGKGVLGEYWDSP